jgi:hypothetical protein
MEGFEPLAELEEYYDLHAPDSALDPDCRPGTYVFRCVHAWRAPYSAVGPADGVRRNKWHLTAVRPRVEVPELCVEEIMVSTRPSRERGQVLLSGAKRSIPGTVGKSERTQVNNSI